MNTTRIAQKKLSIRCIRKNFRVPSQSTAKPWQRERLQAIERLLERIVQSQRPTDLQCFLNDQKKRDVILTLLTALGTTAQRISRAQFTTALTQSLKDYPLSPFWHFERLNRGDHRGRAWMNYLRRLNKTAPPALLIGPTHINELRRYVQKKISHHLTAGAQQDLRVVDDFLIKVKRDDFPQIKKEVQALHCRLTSEGVKMFSRSHRIKTRDEVIDKLIRLNLNSDRGRLNRLASRHFLVGHLNDIIGFRIVLNEVREYRRAIEIIAYHFGNRILYYHNYYFHPTISLRYPFRVVIFTVKYKNYCYEMQLTTLADSVWADLYHETWYKHAIPYNRKELHHLEQIGRYQTLCHTRELLASSFTS